jgi:hypothetical protein
MSTDVSLIALMMEAARTSETSVDIQLRTLQYIPEDSELHTRRRENLKSHIAIHQLAPLKFETVLRRKTEVVMNLPCFICTTVTSSKKCFIKLQKLSTLPYKKLYL